MRDGRQEEPVSLTSNGPVQRVTGRPVAPADIELFAHIEADLYTAVISDALDDMGIRDRAMREHLRPVSPEIVFVGWARTVLCMDLHYMHPDPYALEIEALDSVLPGEVVVVGTGESKRNAPWGELLSTAAMARGARGAVIDGLIRDVKKILALGFPVFAAGIKPVDSRGRGIVVDYNIPVDSGGVTVSPGDLIVADYDGVIAIPTEAVDEAIQRATDKVSRENSSRAELMRGAYLRDVYNKYGVL
jgi:regulator of RNase E activity RraA